MSTRRSSTSNKKSSNLNLYPSPSAVRFEDEIETSNDGAMTDEEQDDYWDQRDVWDSRAGADVDDGLSWEEEAAGGWDDGYDYNDGYAYDDGSSYGYDGN